ncbi:phage major capsid protein [Lachnospiraceae bacterium ZAX-1]
MPGVDINRTTIGVLLTPEESNEILQKTQEDSAFMRLARRVTLPGVGSSINVIVSDPEADWVAETGLKPVSNPTVSSKVMRPYKLAVIETFSDEFRRDKKILYDALVKRIPGALARKFDNTIASGTSPGSDFDTLTTADAFDVSTATYAQLVAIDAAISGAHGNITQYAGSPAFKSILLGTVDTTGRPIFIPDANSSGTVGMVLGTHIYYNRGVYVAGTPNVLGFAGDFTQAVWGTVEGVKISITDQATIGKGDDAINLWQQNMFAVRAEIEVGFRIADIALFKKVTD